MSLGQSHGLSMCMSQFNFNCIYNNYIHDCIFYFIDSDVTEEEFVDLHHVEGLRGVYIASQLKPSSAGKTKINLEEVTSWITYDQGGEWEMLKPPEFDDDGHPIYCQYVSETWGIL